jgi:hypothetical protein
MVFGRLGAFGQFGQLGRRGGHEGYDMEPLSFSVPYGYVGPLFDWDPNLDPPFTMAVGGEGTNLDFDPETGLVSTTVPFGSMQTRSIILEAAGSGGTPYVSLRVVFTSVAGAAPSIGISGPTGQYEGNSGTAAFNFAVTLIGFVSGTYSVNWAVTGSGANPASPSDFLGDVYPSGTLTFTGNGTQYAVVNANGDLLLEPDESFTVTLSDPTNGAVLATATASSVILNDDMVAPAVPAPVLTGNPALLASIDPADMSSLTLDGSGNVSSIAGVDGTSRAYSGTSANGSALPALAVSGGVQTIDFVEALQQYLGRGDSSGVSTNATTGRCSIVAIFERTSASVSTLAVTTIGQASNTASINQLNLLATTAGYLTRKAGASSVVTLTQGAQDQARHLQIGVMTNGTSGPVGYLDGGAGASGATANWPTTLDNTKIGARTTSGTTTAFGSWRLCRWLVYDAVLNATHAEEIAAWAAAHYGTPNV